MNHMSHGLLYRVKRAAKQIGEQHANIGEIFRGFEPAIERGDSEAARDLFRRYCGAIDAHFALEDGVFFPALHGLHPERVIDLETLSEEHVGFLGQLEHLRSLLDTDLAGFGHGLRSLASELGIHESREERLVRELADPELESA